MDMFSARIRQWFASTILVISAVLPLLGGLFAPAGRADTSAPGSAVAQPMTPLGTLYVVIGGNGTCTLSGVSPMFPNLQDNDLFRSFSSVIVAPGFLTANDNVLFVCYEWLSPMMRFYDARYQPWMAALHEGQLDELVLSRANGISRVVIIGHSHGGWRAIKLAASPYLANNLSAPLTLVSVDPVSKVTCQRLREPGCRDAPSDFTPEELGYLNARVRWLNVYQTRGLLLSSGMMPAAHSNIEVFSNHVAIQSNPTVWQAARAWILGM